ncbi:MAG: primosomal protein N' (replication factor Y) [Marinobacter psychrophilus]
MPGTRVSVPFGHQKAILGIAISATLVEAAPAAAGSLFTNVPTKQTNKPTHKLRSIHHTLEANPVLSKELLALCRWCADYYHYPLGDTCQLALPAILRKPVSMPKNKQLFWVLNSAGAATLDASLVRAPKQQKALVLFKQLKKINQNQLQQHDINAATIKALHTKKLLDKQEFSEVFSPLNRPSTLLKENALSLNYEQKVALDSIVFDQFNAYLLDGITGSGKTEVYLQAIHSVLNDNKQALILVPEIGLTPQTAARFQNRFNVPVATVHSGLSKLQRFKVWQAIKHNQYPIVIGTRSSVFSPLNNLGLIVVDEEHDLSYKQQDGVRYSARDLAIVRAQKLNIPLILGSATPSLETLNNALSGRYQHLTLRRRAQTQSLPTIKYIASTNAGLGEEAKTAIRQTLARGQQVLVFINRRGYAPTLICQNCKWMSQCSACDNRMTLHRTQPKMHNTRQYLHCHRCDYRTGAPTKCPNCNSSQLSFLGSGTQREEEVLEKIFVDTPILRIDKDSTSQKGRLEELFQQVNTGKPCILVGTQMLAKGHHFANLGLGIILGLDQSFFSSDFRGAERIGQLLTQVSGRIGREDTSDDISQVLIQTQFEDHPLLQQLLKQNYYEFAKTLLSERQLTAMPPYQFIAIIRCHSPRAELAQEFLQQARHQAESIMPPHTNLQYLGPMPATVEKRANRYHFILQIKSSSRLERQQLLKQLCQQLEINKQSNDLHWLVDIDPQEF